MLDDDEHRLMIDVSRGLLGIYAELDGRVVGYSYATLYRSRSAYRHSIEDSLYG